MVFYFLKLFSEMNLCRSKNYLEPKAEVTKENVWKMCCKNVHSSIIHESKIVETTPMHITDEGINNVCCNHAGEAYLAI